MSIEKKPEERIDFKVLALAAVGAAIFSFIARILTSYVLDYYIRDYTFSQSERTAIIGSPYFVLIIVLLGVLTVPSIRSKFSKKGLGYLYINVLVSVPIAGFMGVYWDLGLISGARVLYSSTYGQVMPSFWAPSAEVISPGNMGHVSFPIAQWAVPIVFWTIVYYSLSLTAMSAMAILRRLWLEVESLPFPYAQPNVEFIEAASNPKMDKSSRKVLLIGLLLGFLYFFPPLLRTILPWFPDIYGWTGGAYLVSHPGTFDIVRGAPGIAQIIVGLTYVNVNIMPIALYYFLPLSTLLTTWVFYIIFFQVLPQILFAMGYYSNLVTATTGNARHYIIQQNPPLIVESITHDGVLPALIIFNVILNWKYIRDTLKAAVGRPSQGFERPNEVSYRILYGMFCLGVILFLGIVIGSGGVVWQALVVTVIMLVWGMGFNRVHALAGIHGGGDWGYATGLSKWMNPDITNLNQMTTSYWAVQYWPAVGLIGHGGPLWYGQGFTMGDSFNLSQYSGVTPKMAYWTAVVSHLVAAPVAFITLLWLWYTVGWLNTPASKMEFTAGFISQIDPATATSVQNMTFFQPYQIAFGFILTGLFSWARATFVWFPFDAVGLFLIGIPPIGFFGWWNSFLIAWILKVATLRIGGTNLYERVGTKFAAGFAGGFLFGTITGSIASVFRFIVPA